MGRRGSLRKVTEATGDKTPGQDHKLLQDITTEKQTRGLNFFPTRGRSGAQRRSQPPPPPRLGLFFKFHNGTNQGNPSEDLTRSALKRIVTGCHGTLVIRADVDHRVATLSDRPFFKRFHC